MALGGKSIVQTEIEIKGAKKAESEIKDVSGQIGGLGQMLKGSASGLAAFGGYAAAAGAALGVLGTVIAGVEKAMRLALVVTEQMGRAFVHLGQRGGEFAAIAAGYERLADARMIANLQELTGWHLQQRDIMTSYTRAMDVGIITQEQFAEALDLITARAQQTGEGVDVLLERMTPLLQGRGIEQITEFGVQTGVLNDELRRLGISAESADGQQRRLTTALRLAREQIGETNNAVSNLSDSWEAYNTQINDYLDNMSRVISTHPALVDSFETVRKSIEDMGLKAQDAGAMVARAVGLMIAVVSRAVALQVGAIRDIVRVHQYAMNYLGIDTPNIDAAIEFMDRVVQTAQDVRATAIQGLAAGPTGAAGAAVPPPRRPRRSGGAGGGDEMTAAQIADEEFFNDIIFLRIELQEQARAAELQGYIDVREAREALAETFQRIDQQNLEIEEERHERRMQMDIEKVESLQAGYAALAEIEEEAAEAERERYQQTIDNVTTVVSSTQKAFNAVSTVIGAIGGDTEKAAKQQGAFIIAFSGVMAAVELAQSIKSFASQDYVAGVAHLASMAAFIAAAAQAASDLGGGTAKTPAGSTQTFTPAAGQNVTTQSGEPSSITIVESYSFGRTSSDIGRTVREADWAFQSSGEVSGRGLSAEFGV